MENESPDALPPQAFTRLDEGDDLAFYSFPRLVHHIDEVAVAALTATYRQLIPPDSAILDLMSSWVSHLPDELPAREVIGHGMNEEELAANPRLTRWFIQDLNRDQALPIDSDSLDAVLCCVGMQYLQHPIDVAREVRRILKPGGRFLVSFSNRCFWTKAVEIWRKLSDHGHNNLVRWYLEQAGFSDIESFVPSDGSKGDPMIVVSGRA
jgi:SAM-dependent methyltransferase